MSTFDTHGRGHQGKGPGGGRFTGRQRTEPSGGLEVDDEAVEVLAADITVGDKVLFKGVPDDNGWPDVEAEVLEVRPGVNIDFIRVVDIRFRNPDGSTWDRQYRRSATLRHAPRTEQSPVGADDEASLNQGEG